MSPLHLASLLKRVFCGREAVLDEKIVCLYGALILDCLAKHFSLSDGTCYLLSGAYDERDSAFNSVLAAVFGGFGQNG